MLETRPTGQRQVEWEFDDLYRLIRETACTPPGVSCATIYETTYAYDAVGNRTLRTHTGESNVASEVDDNDRLVSVDGETLLWDDNGNLLGETGVEHGWDDEDRMLSALEASSGSPRDSRRLHSLRGWRHGKTEQIL